LLSLAASLLVADSYANPTHHSERAATVLADDATGTTKILVLVQRPDGTPVENAVVFTSAGGRGVSDARGVAAFEVHLPRSASALHVSAASTDQGVSMLGSVRIAMEERSGAVDAGTIVIERGMQCQPEWVPQFAPDVFGAAGTVFAMVNFDDGSGPALYAGGFFTTADGLTVNRIARWDGFTWSPLGGGVTGDVNALAVFDDGTGPALFAAGIFDRANPGGITVNNIAKWNGTSWSALGTGTNGQIRALAVYTDPIAGPGLYAAGTFTTAGGMSVNNIARWNGATWSSVAFPPGVPGAGFNDRVSTLAVFNNELYAGGFFTTANGAQLSRIARWNGFAWIPVGSGFNGIVQTLAVHNNTLYAGGGFTASGATSVNRVARWTGSSWAPLGSGMDDLVYTLRSVNDGSGAALYAGGFFSTAGGNSANFVARWNGSSWSSIGNGTNNQVFALGGFDDGTGPALFVGGRFSSAGVTEASLIAKWDGGGWEPLASGLSRDGTPNIWAATTFDAGSGPALVVGGDFTSADGAASSNIATWDGVSWSPLGSGANGPVFALGVFDDGSGPALFAGGRFDFVGGVAARRIARWNGSAWSSVGSGITGTNVQVFTTFDDGSGPALYAGGTFTNAGGVAAGNIAKWNGTAWSALGSGASGTVDALAVFDDGSGPRLYASGSFTSAGGSPASRIARWDGLSWAPVGGGLGGATLATFSSLAVFDDGSGPALFAGGSFDTAGSVPANSIAKWNGSEWAPLGAGLNNDPFTSSVLTLTAFDDGSGQALYACGSFDTADGTVVNGIARWDGAAWSPLGVGVEGIPATMTPFDDGSGPALFVGGLSLTSAGGLPAGGLAKWQGCESDISCPGDSNGDNIINFTDLNAVLADFGQSGMGLPGDTNGDGVVNFTDLNEVLAAFGTSCN
jgi:hypothetical protein